MPPLRPPGGALSSFSKKDVVAKNKAAMGNNSQSRWEPSDAELDELREFLAARPGDSLRLEMLSSEDPELASLLHAKRNQDLAAMQAICTQLGGELKAREDDLLLLLAVEGLCVLLATTDPGAIGVSEAALIEQMAERIVAHVRG